VNHQAVLVRAVFTLLAALAALWLANTLGFGLCVQIIMKLGHGVFGLVAGIFGVGR
jgi:hypothetical protein